MPRPTLPYTDFWPDYLRAHKRPLTRALHSIGTILGLALLGAGATIADWRLIAAAPFSATESPGSLISWSSTMRPRPSNIPGSR